MDGAYRSTGDIMTGPLVSAISTAHDLFPLLEHGEMVWLRTQVPESPSRSPLPASDPADGQQRVVHSQGDSDCVIVEGEATGTAPEGTQPHKEAGSPLQEVRGDDGNATSSFQGRTVWEAARVVWFDLFPPEPEVHLVLCPDARQEQAIPCDHTRDMDLSVASGTPQILARMSDIQLRREVGEGSGIQYRRGDDVGTQSQSHLAYEDDVMTEARQGGVNDFDAALPTLSSLLQADERIDLTGESS